MVIQGLSGVAPGAARPVVTAVEPRDSFEPGRPALAVERPVFASGPANLEPTEPDPLALENYLPEAPLRTRLHELDEPGTRFHLTGTVRGTDGQAVEFARIEVWMADAEGVYDPDNGRGRQMAGWGGFHFHSVRPGAAEGRAACIHIKVEADDYEPLTTRLFFAGDPAAQRDPAYSAARALEPVEVGHGDIRFQLAEFDIVLNSVTPVTV